MTNEQMQAELDKMLSMCGAAMFNRLVYLTNEIQRLKTKEQQAQCQKKTGEQVPTK